jgi:hypothetical protein
MSKAEEVANSKGESVDDIEMLFWENLKKIPVETLPKTANVRRNAHFMCGVQIQKECVQNDGEIDWESTIFLRNKLGKNQIRVYVESDKYKDVKFEEFAILNPDIVKYVIDYKTEPDAVVPVLDSA